MLTSDLIGGIGGVLLAAPAVKDQYYRFKEAGEAARKRTSPAPKLREILSLGWKARRNDYDGFDSAATAIGAIAIVLAFGFKLFDA